MSRPRYHALSFRAWSSSTRIPDAVGMFAVTGWYQKSASAAGVPAWRPRNMPSRSLMDGPS
jgi:hypothetical protein